MRSSAEGRNATGRYGAARGLAPHVDENWAESFVVELRLIGIQGTRIGDALSEVESHCGESAQSAQQAFGDPAVYARSLPLPIHTDTSPRALLRSVSPTVLQVLGMLMLLWGFAAWRQGGRLEITTVHLVTVAIFLLGVAVLVRFADRVLRLVTHHPGLLWIVLMASTAAFAVAFRFLDDVVWRVAAGWSLGAGAAALAAGMVWAFARLRAPGSQDGPITSPFDDAAASSGAQEPGSTRRSFGPSLLSTLPYTAMIPAGTMLLLAVTWWLTS
jgi:hypothetical protein